MKPMIETSWQTENPTHEGFYWVVKDEVVTLGYWQDYGKTLIDAYGAGDQEGLSVERIEWDAWQDLVEPAVGGRVAFSQK